MTCKECIHDRVCHTYSGGIPRAHIMGDKAETKCGLFKNSADKQAIGTKSVVDKIVIHKAVLNEKPIKEFIERMGARGFNVDTDGISVIITGDNIETYYDEIQRLAVDMTPFFEKQMNEARERAENQLNNI